jgi:hypothetical protein
MIRLYLLQRRFVHRKEPLDQRRGAAEHLRLRLPFRVLPPRSRRYFLPEHLGFEGLEHELEIILLLVQDTELLVEPLEQPSTKPRGVAVFMNDVLTEAIFATADIPDLFLN